MRTKRLWRCGDADCDVKELERDEPSHRRPGVAHRAGPVEACRRVGQDNHAVAQVGRSFGVGWWAVMNAVNDHGRPLVDDPDRLGAVGGLGLDETTWLRANATRHTAYVTGAPPGSVPTPRS